MAYAQPAPKQIESNAKLFRVAGQSDGIFIQLSGNPNITISRTNAPDRIVIDLEGLTVSPELHNAVIPYGRLGVSQMRVAQHQPTIARIVLDLDTNDPLSRSDWQAFNAGGGTILLRPTGSLAPETSSPTLSATKAQVQGIALTSTGQLLIQTDRPTAPRILQQGSTYIVDIGSASLSDNFRRPTIPSDSPIQRLRLDEIGDVVRVTVVLDPDWRMVEADRSSTQISLQLNRGITFPNVANRGRGLIIIDPGHGGGDPGAVGNGIQEKDVVLAMSLRLGRILQGMGYSVQYTRTTDVEIGLQPRVELANNLRADVFISIHANSLASGNSPISGIETYHNPGSTAGFSLATLVQQQLVRATGGVDRGVKSARFYVIRHTQMPSILVETGFVTNPQEAANLNNPNYQERLAQAMANGIDQFLRTGR
jgi:N-acetylmuramoyl-L-alanine amidase